MKPIRSIAAGATAALLCAATAHAGERDGVSCPTGADASVQQGVLKCAVTLEHIRLSMCPRADYPNYTQIEIRGVDQCKPQVVPLQGKASVDSAMTPLPVETRVARLNRPVSDPAVISALGVFAAVPPADSAYQRRIDQVSQDRFIAIQVVYVWPKGMPLPSTVGHDPKNGVACPSGFDATVLDGRGLRCSDTVIHKAGCDSINPLNPLSPWTVERRTGRDLCVSKDVTGNRVTGQYTIPVNAGYVGAMGNPAQHGWALDTDRSGNVDYWVKNGTVYKYPVAR
jgi:hypothetical protein